MAGVGFELRRLLRRRTFAAFGISFLYGAALAAGPWLLTVLTMVCLQIWVKPLLGLDAYVLFGNTVMYAFCGSLILSAPWVMLSTRFAADQIFLHRRERIPAGVHLSMTWTAAFGLTVLLVLASWTSWRDPQGHALAYRTTAGVLLLCLSLVWVVLGTISYVRWYRWVVVSFLASGACSLLAAVGLSRSLGALGALIGYTLGFVLLLGCLYALWRRRYTGPAWEPDVIKMFSRWWMIAGVGLFYQLGVWADKLTLWMLCGEPLGQTPMRVLPRYDVLTFLAYLSVVPMLSYFLIIMETQFFSRYREYLTRVRRGRLDTVRESEDRLRDGMFHGLRRMAEYQAVITLCLMLAAEPIMGWFNLWDWPVGLFRILLLAAGCQVLLLTVILLMLYFELRREAFVIAALFAGLNIALTAWSVAWPAEWLGAGYLIAVAVSTLVATAWLAQRMRRITFLIFSRQPIVDT